jgi:signal transduction histidine kinase
MPEEYKMKHKKFTRLGAFILVLCIFMGLVPGALAAGEQADTVKIGLINLKGYASKDSSGSIVGVNAEYAYRIAQYANLKIELVLFDSGPAALTALDNGEIDMMCNVIKTDQREAKYLFTENAVGSLAMCVFVGRNEGRFSYNYAEQLKSMTIGYEKDSKVADTFVSWCAQRGITPNLREYSSLADIKTAIDTGRLDAGLYGSPTVDGYRTIQNFSPVSYYFVFRKTDTGLKSRVDDAMGSILSEEPLYFEKLLQKYTSSKIYRMEALTANESYYISQHPALSVAVLEGDEPYYCTGRDGTPAGIIPDFFEKISDLTDLSFTYKTYATQDAAVSAVKNGEADILGMYSDGQISSYNSGLRITRAYADVDIVLLTHSGTGVNDVKNCAVKNRSINTIRSSTSNILTTKYVGYDSVSECFDALKRGETDGMLCGLPTATWFSNQNLSAAFSIVTLSSGAIELCAATAYPNVMLCSILSKAISASAYSFSETVASNTQSEDSLETLISRIPPIRIVIVVALLLLLVAFLIWAIVSLRRHQKERVAILAKSAETDRKEAEIAALEKAAEEKNAFFSNISHDMRTPLNAILGFSRLCDQETDLGAIRSYNAKIQSSGALLLDLINDTLTISKAGSGKLQLHLVPVDSRKLVDSIAIPIREEARKKNITFTVDCSAAAERTIMADELGVQKIFLNLLSNSIKYTPEGGHISMRLYNEPGAGRHPGFPLHRQRRRHRHIRGFSAASVRALLPGKAAGLRICGHRSGPFNSKAAGGGHGRQHSGAEQGRLRHHLHRPAPFSAGGRSRRKAGERGGGRRGLFRQDRTFVRGQRHEPRDRGGAAERQGAAGGLRRKRRGRRAEICRKRRERIFRRAYGYPHARHGRLSGHENHSGAPAPGREDRPHNRHDRRRL